MPKGFWRGFTLIELIIVVVILGVIGGFAVPQYRKSTERVKAAMARHNIALINEAQSLYLTQYRKTVTADSKADIITTLGSVTEMQFLDADRDWEYYTYPCAGVEGSVCVDAQRLANGSPTGRAVGFQTGAGAAGAWSVCVSGYSADNRCPDWVKGEWQDVIH